MPVNPELLEILVCPQCKGELQVTPNQDALNCQACRLQYAIRDDIPNMLIQDARPLPPQAGE